MSRAATVPERAMPLINALAILPPPMKSSFII
jgi:hypothetical protein